MKRPSKNILLFAGFLSISMTASAQNLVPNPGFETTISDHCGLMFYTDFNPVMSEWTNPTQGSPDLYLTNIQADCYNFQPNSQYPGPIGIKGSQEPRTGRAMIGFGVYTITNMNQREYVQVELTSPLVVGGEYVVEYYISLADSVEFASDKIQALLSTSAVTSNDDQYLSQAAQVSTNGFVSDVQNWTRVIDTITADQAYTHLTIGNFRPDIQTGTANNPSYSSQPGTYGSYYFLDDVRVERILTSGIAETSLEEVAIFPNPFTEDISVKLPSGIDVEVEIFNALGEIVYRAIGSEILTVDARQFSSGVYTVQIVSTVGNYRQSIVKL